MLALGALLAACGGGGGDPTIDGGGSGGNGGTSAGVPATVSVSLLNANGQASNTISSSVSLTASAVVLDKNGAGVSNALVTFAADNALVLFTPDIGTALTDGKGVASVTMRPTGIAASGAGTLTVAAVKDGVTVSGSTNFVVGATSVVFGELTLSPASISAYGTSQVSIDVLSGGVKYTNQSIAVNFSSTCVTAGKATLASVVQTVNGNASVGYRDQGCGMKDTITASASGIAGSRSAALTVEAPKAASIQFYAADPVDKSIVIQGEGGLLRKETATLKFRVFDISGNPLAGREVVFEKADTAANVTLNLATGITDVNGEVTTTVNSRNTPLSFRIKATLKGQDISTLSDSIVVTTGVPVQRAFSLSMSDSNLEGLTLDTNGNVPSASVMVAIGDKFGNPVADGTPVVFQSNVGVVGSSSKGGCNTQNGACSVDFRAQDPRTPIPNLPATVCNGPLGSSDFTRAGVGTICASTSDGSATPIFDRIGFYMSGSVPGKVFLNGGTELTQGMNVNDLGSVGRTASKVFTLQINDINGNPMPSGTTIDISDIVGASAGGVSPSSVQKIFPNIATQNVSYQGSSHIVTIGSTVTPTCTAPNFATFNINVTTPHLRMTSYPFKLTFTCQ
ncbi:hypothetical protein CSQ94_07765 [Janthinobacterium sp. BJB312]|nr:hypothetical protein CSQ94_07765 [Janthinobacterium sp. BJB312]